MVSCERGLGYLGAIEDALTGVEAARVVLAKARQRLEQDRGQCGL
jgi:hypothetical protein